MNTKLSGVNMTSVTLDTDATSEYLFSITLNTNLSGLIREDSLLTVTFAYATGENTATIPCYESGSLITSHTFSGLTIPNTDNDNTITAIVLEFDYLDDTWATINFTYNGTMTEQITYSNVVTPP